MAMYSNAYRGMGFFTMDISSDMLYKFVLKHRDNISDEDIQKKLNELDTIKEKSENDIEDLLDIISVYTDEKYGDTNPNSIIAHIMKQETNMEFRYYNGNQTEEEGVLYKMRYQWGYNDDERKMTEEDVQKTIFKYANELNIPGIDEFDDIGIITVEYFG